MQFSTRMRYGCRALVELAARYPDSVVSVKDMGESQHISPKYLEHIMSALKAAGLVKSVRGLHGGYALAKPPGQCRLSEVFRALEGSAAPVDCVDDPESCPMRELCPTRETWAEVKGAILHVLESTTVQDLLQRRRKRAASQAHTYQI